MEPLFCRMEALDTLLEIMKEIAVLLDKISQTTNLTFNVKLQQSNWDYKLQSQKNSLICSWKQTLKVLQDLLITNNDTPWSISNTTADIKILLQEFITFNVMHCYKECNQAANWPARNARIQISPCCGRLLFLQNFAPFCITICPDPLPDLC